MNAVESNSWFPHLRSLLQMPPSAELWTLLLTTLHHLRSDRKIPAMVLEYLWVHLEDWSPEFQVTESLAIFPLEAPLVKTLNWSGLNLGKEVQQQHLLKMLSHEDWPYNKVRVLNLSGNQLKAQGLDGFLKHWRFPQVRTLDLSRNSLATTGIQLLLDSAMVTQIEHLLLDGNNLSFRGMDALLNSTDLHQLKGLSLGKNKMRGVAIENLLVRGSESLPSLEWLSLQGNTLREVEIQQLFLWEKMSVLKHLDLSGSPAVGEFLEKGGHFHPGFQPESLALRQCKLSKTAMTALCRQPWFSELKTLDLSDNSLSGEGFRLLVQEATLSNLRSLRLKRCGLSENDLTLLGKEEWKNLRQLDLSQNWLSEHSCVFLNALVERSGIQSLKLDGNRISGDSLPWMLGRPLGKAFRGEKYLMEELTGLDDRFQRTDKTLVFNRPLSEELIRGLYRVQRLQGLKKMVCQYKQVEHDCFVSLLTPALPTLEELNFRQCRLSNDSLDWLAEQPSSMKLKVVDLAHNGFSSESLLRFVSSEFLEGVEELLLEENQVNTRVCEALVQNPHSSQLKVLGIQNSRLRMSSLISLSKAPYFELKRLDIGRMNLSDETIRQLSQTSLAKAAASAPQWPIVRLLHEDFAEESFFSTLSSISLSLWSDMLATPGFASLKQVYLQPEVQEASGWSAEHWLQLSEVPASLSWEQVSLHVQRASSASIATSLQQMPFLTMLELTPGLDWTWPELYEVLSALPKTLQSLTIQGFYHDSISLPELSKAPFASSLTTLQLNDCWVPAELQKVEQCYQFPAVKRLTIHRHDFPLQTMQDLLESGVFPVVKEVNSSKQSNEWSRFLTLKDEWAEKGVLWQ
jgi:Leucine-rich repeat (LRR) protein